MSANNQILVKEHNGKFYVFSVMAETWGEWNYETMTPISRKNYLNADEARGVFNTREEAHEFAHKLDEEDDYIGSEYGVVDEVLYKDNAPVIIRTNHKSIKQQKASK